MQLNAEGDKRAGDVEGLVLDKNVLKLLLYRDAGWTQNIVVVDFWVVVAREKVKEELMCVQFSVPTIINLVIKLASGAHVSWEKVQRRLTSLKEKTGKVNEE